MSMNGQRVEPPAWARARQRARLEHGNRIPPHLAPLFASDPPAPRRAGADAERMIREGRAAQAAYEARLRAKWERHRAEREAGLAAYEEARVAWYGVAASALGEGWWDGPWPVRVF